MYTSSYIGTTTPDLKKTTVSFNASTYIPRNFTKSSYTPTYGESTYAPTRDQNLHPLTRIDLESAKAIASRLFDYYNSEKSSKLSARDALSLIQDVKSMTNSKDLEHQQDPEEASEQFLRHHDRDGDGALTRKDFIECCVQYLCGPGGTGVNLSGKVTAKQQLLEALYGQVGEGEVERELQGATLIFDKYDINNDDYLDRSEVRNMMRDTYESLRDNIQMTDEAVDKYFSMIGTEKKDMISREEYELFILEALKSRNLQ